MSPEVPPEVITRRKKNHTCFSLHFDPLILIHENMQSSFNISMASLIKASREISLLEPTRCFQNKESFPVHNLHVPEDCCLELQESMVFLNRKLSSARTAEVLLS